MITIEARAERRTVKPFALPRAMCSCALALVLMTSVAQAQVVPDESLMIGAQSASAVRQPHRVRRNDVAALHPSGDAALPGASTTSLPPITDADVSKPGFLGDRFTYEADLSSMFQGGNTRRPNSNLPGGLDASLVYKVNRTLRLGASYYTFAATPLGDADPNVPIVFQGTTKPIGYFNAEGAGVDGTAQPRIQVYSVQQLFFIGGRHHPLVIAPAYAAIRSSVGGTDDVRLNFANGQIMSVHQTSTERKSINLGIPLFYAEKYLISYTGGVTWNMEANGANLTNHPQYTQSLFSQYQPDPSTTFFASAAKNIVYFPTEVFPYHNESFHLGVSKMLAKPLFIEAEVTTAGPSNPNYTNIGRIGLVDLTIPCPRTAEGGAPTLTCVALAKNGVAVPQVGANRYTTFTLLLGIGAAPLVRPF